MRFASVVGGERVFPVDPITGDIINNPRLITYLDSIGADYALVIDSLEIKSVTFSSPVVVIPGGPGDPLGSVSGGAKSRPMCVVAMRFELI